MLIKLKENSNKIKELKLFLDKNLKSYDYKISFNFIEIISKEKSLLLKLIPYIEAFPYIEDIQLSLNESFPLIKSLKNKKKEDFFIIAGPCSVESKENYFKNLKKLQDLKIKYVRAALYKPRTSPYTFQGLGDNGIDILKKAKKEFKMKFVSEVFSLKEINLLYEISDIFQVGARNMKNYSLLKELGKTKKTILLKRAQGASLKDWLFSAEYILKEGNENIILCERGDYPFFKDSSINFKIAMQAQKETNLKVIIDATHSSGNSENAFKFALATRLLNFDGLMIETSINPNKAKIDGKYALNYKDFKTLLFKMRKIKECIKN